MNWTSMLDDFGRSLITALGHDPDWLPGDHNPVTRAIGEPGFIEKYGELGGFSRIGLSRAATICQMVLFDARRGPEGDGERKALRRHWYAWYKLQGHGHGV